MRKGGITAANCTCSIWEGINESLINLAKWKSWFKEYSDLIIQVNEIEDILYAKKNRSCWNHTRLAKHEWI